MSEIFFRELKISEPKYRLNIGSFNHGKQTGKMMELLENIFLDENPIAVLVYGDTNSTLAGALVAAKLHMKVIHIEAGLRSFNKSMPEEINRIATDHISDFLFVPTQIGIENLKREGITDRVFKTGDIMCDMLDWAKEIVDGELAQTNYYYATIHRPYNTDDSTRLMKIISALSNLDKKVIFSVHPRTRSKLYVLGFEEKNYPNLELIEPVS